MTQERKKALEKNFLRMFLIRLFYHLKFLNIVISLFYVARGLTLQQILYLNIIWAITTVLFEIPSSYLADVWGRKRTILIGLAFGLMQMSVFIFAQGFWEMAVGMFFYGLLSACISGTDIALLYDTQKELGKEEDYLSTVGKYWSGMNLGKILSSLIAAYIARDLTETQFQFLIILDLISMCFAIGMALRLREPEHKMDLEKQEAGILKDAWAILRRNPGLRRAIINAEFIWLGAYATWSYYQAFYYSLGVSVITIGIVWSISHAGTFLARYHIKKIESYIPLPKLIDATAVWTGLLFSGIIIGYYASWNGHVLFALFGVAAVAWNLRKPLFDSYYNSFSFSFNRATTLSLTGFLHNILEIPIMLFLGALVGLSPIYPYIAVVVVIIIILFFFRLSHETRIAT